MRIFKILFICSLILAFELNTFSIAADCSKACIDLTVEDGELVITGKRTAPKPKYTPRPTVKPIARPTVKAPIKSKRKPRIASVRKKVVTKSLNDQIRQILPTASIYLQPQSGVLIHEPVIFWTDSPQSFKKSLYLLDVKIDLDLTVKFSWIWGDGSTLATSLIGAPFPSFEITHIYSQSGLNKVSLSSKWSGRYRLDGGVWLQIPRVITTTRSTQIQISQARTVFTG
ncbi:hypothetical protein LBMAG10_00390 [Actinomycetes bacterium]|nr:hypothetical protein LBMAG10_00390 [Actinomycetes bacterium]